MIRPTTPKEGYRYDKAWDAALQDFKIRNIVVKDNKDEFKLLVKELYELGYDIELMLFPKEGD